VVAAVPASRRIKEASEAGYEPGTIDCIDLGLIPADLPFGQISPIAGDAAYQYIARAAELAQSGQIDAIYYNPTKLPFAKAQATRDGATVRLFFELQAGHYNGSTYDLTYDAAKNQLVGTYYQAVAKQSFEVQFARK